VQLADLVGAPGETVEVADRDPALDLAASADGDAIAGSAEAVVVTVLVPSSIRPPARPGPGVAGVFAGEADLAELQRAEGVDHDGELVEELHT
jgi:hypothetical protein